MTDSREIRNLANGVGDEIGKGYDDSTEPVPKKQRKSRNESEKRRREKLNVYISELANMVPQCSAAQRKLDKTTILKLTVNYIKVYNDLTVSVLGNRTGVQSMVFSSEELGELMDQVLDGLLLVMTRSGKLVYISESVNSLLGFTKEFVMGKSIYEFLHPDDRHQVVKELTREDTVVFHSTSAGSSPKVAKPPSRRSFKIRLKVNENEKERNEFYEGFHCVGYLDNWTNGKVRPADVQGTFKDVQQQVKLNREAEFPPEEKCFVGVALSARSNLKRPLSSNIDKTGKEYLSRHTLDGKLLYVDTRSISITGYLPFEVLGTSIYKYIHHDDMKVVAKYHKTLMEYGECTSDCYRLLTKGDQWIWLQSRIYISYNHWNSKPELYVSTNQVISEEEGLKALNERIIQEGSFCASTMQPLKAIDVCSENQEINEAALSSSSKNELCSSDGAESGISNNEKKAEDSSFVSASMELPSSEVSTLQIPGSKVSPVHNVSENDVTVAEDEESNKIVGVLTAKDLESFVEAQRQLQEQLARKHSSLEEAIGKQKEQLRIIQQHMFLNIQAQLTVDPNKNQEIISREFERTRILTEEHEKQEKRQKELSMKLAEQQKQAEERYQVQLNLLLRNKPYLLEEKPRHQLNELPLSQMQQKQFLPVEENVVSSHNTTTLPLASNNLPAIADNEHGVRLTSLSRQNVPYSSSIATHRDTQQFLSSPDIGAQTFDSRQRPLIFQQLQSQSQVHGNPLQGQNHQNAVTSLWQQRKLQEQLDQISSSAIPQSSSLDLESSLAQYTAFSNKPLGSTAGVDFSASASQSQALVPQEHLKNSAGLTLQQKQYNDSQALQNLQELLSSRENVHQLVSSLSSRPDLTKSLLGILQLAQNNASPTVADQSGTSLSNASIGLGATQLQASALQNKSSLPSLFHHPLQKQPPIQQQKLQQIQLQQQQQQQLQQQQQQRQQQQKQQQQQQQQQQRQQQQQQQQHQQQRQHQQQDLFQFGKRGQSSPAVSFPTASSNVTLPGSLSSRTSSAASQVQQISKPLTDSSEFTRTSNSKEKSKVKRDYFSNFTSSELQAMLLRSLPRMTTNEVDSTECTTPEEKKLKDEPQRYNPLLTEYRELLDMQQEQGKQLIINQQKQIWEQLQRNESELEQRSTDSPQLQQTRDKTQSSYFNVPLKQTTKDECFRYASSGPSGSGLSTWDQGLEPINLGISDEDDQVLNLLLAESSLDPLFTDPMSWGDDNGFVANLNPD